MGRRPTPNHTIDRIDNNGDYCPENCRWATWSEQARSRSNNRIIEHNGKAQTLAAWCEEAGLTVNTLWYRLKRGWDMGKALSTPADMRRHEARIANAAIAQGIA